MPITKRLCLIATLYFLNNIMKPLLNPRSQVKDLKLFYNRTRLKQARMPPASTSSPSVLIAYKQFIVN